MTYSAMEIDISLHEYPILTYHLTLRWGSTVDLLAAPVFLTCHYVLTYDLDVVIAVGPCVLMPEANHMPQLMYHNAELVTVLANRDSLRTIATLPNKRTTSASKKNIFDELRLCLP
jgi:hypothetical protein